MHAFPIASAALCALLSVSPALAQEGAWMRRVSLEEAIRLALERSPAAISSESAVRFAQADVLESRGAWFPSLSATSSFSNSSNERFDQSTGRLVS